MGRRYPAVDVRSDHPDLVFAIVDDFSPTAIEEGDKALRVFFQTADTRNAAARALSNANCGVSVVDIDDEDWARRSQENLRPVTVGRITVAPPWALTGLTTRSTDVPEPLVPSLQQLLIVILPSMGFGTGHHATTRLCLKALQTLDLTNRVVLDVGTGSGILAIASRRLGARQAIGYDDDPDAIQAAAGNLAINPDLDGIEWRIADLASAELPAADVVVANLTGALLVRAAPHLKGAVTAGGFIVVSGLLADERSSVVNAYRPAEIAWEQREEEWIALAFRVDK